MAHNCFSNLESSKYKGGKKEAAESSAKPLIPCVEEELGMKLMLSSLAEGFEAVQGES